MQNANYDPASVESIYSFARKLTGRSLSEATFIPNAIANDKNRGDLGSLVESFFFELEPGSDSGPDFTEAGLELKTTGVLRAASGGYKAKERLVLGMINFEKVVNESWEESSFLRKCRVLLILFYLYEKERPVVDRRFVLDPLLFRASEADLIVIRSDWEFIRQKIMDGEAHELSEGDTVYLGACRKGSGGLGESLRKQPFSEIGAKSRAFAFKQGFMSSLIGNHESDSGFMAALHESSFEEVIVAKFDAHREKSVLEISKSFDVMKSNKNQKGFHRNLAVKILSDGGHSVPELQKAGVEMKTIRLGARGRPKESMSFPGFKFLEILEETWEGSSFYEKLEKKFLFVIFRPDKNGVERLDRVLLWNMPYGDRLEAMRVWEDTKRRVAIDATDLPKSSESHIAHVRPKGRNGSDKIATPQGGMHLRQCFWLNAGYLEQVIGGTGTQIVGNNSSIT
jgi:DNA mismatch repair protein MutH